MTINVALLVAETNSSGFMDAIFSVLTFIVYALGAFSILGLILYYFFPEFIKGVTGLSLIHI